MIKLEKDTPFIELLKSHPKAVKKAMRELNMPCLECKGIARENVSQVAVANGLDVDRFIGLIKSSIEKEKT